MQHIRRDNLLDFGHRRAAGAAVCGTAHLQQPSARASAQQKAYREPTDGNPRGQHGHVLRGHRPLNVHEHFKVLV